MEKTEIYEKLTPVFHDVFDDDNLVLKDALTADDVDEWDSLNHIRLMVSIEKAFGVRFAAAEVGGLKNVGELVSLIAAKTG